MIRRLTLSWPAALSADTARPIRLLAVSDERVAGLADSRNWPQLGQIDVVLGCGDLEPDYLAFLSDAFRAPLLYVRGNHDRGGAWTAGREHLPVPISGRVEDVCGLQVAGLSWPSGLQGRAERDDLAAWRQALNLAAHTWLRRRRPQIVISHVPPEGAGDTPADPYHTGFAAYRWLCRRLQPALWLHGHTTLAAVESWRSKLGPTILVNVTGAALIELTPTDRPGRPA